MTRWLETDSLSNQDISSALAIGAYTADADRLILVQFMADQIAGNGDYVFYVTLRINGAGSSYQLVPTTTATVASGVTAIGGQSAMIAVRSGDVLTVYLDGLAGDNSTPDTTVRWFELAALRPTTADRTLDVSAGGEAGIDWANVGSPTTTVGLSGTTVKTATDVETDTQDIQTRLPAALVDGRIEARICEIAPSTITASAFDGDAITSVAIAGDAIGAKQLAEDAGTEIAAAVRTELAAELARIDEDVSAGAHAGDAMTLADDAITAAKYDQTTAHPLALADTGSTAVARTGADSDTLETLSDEIAGSGLTAQETANAVHNLAPAGTPAAGSVGAHLDTLITTTNAIKAITDDLDVTAVTQVAASNAGHLTITAGLTFSESVTGLTIPADWVAAVWTLKQNVRDPDTAALVQLRTTNPAAGTDGLQRLNGAALVAPITADDGELTVTQATGRIDVYLTDEMTARLGAATAIGWDIKFIGANDDSTGRRGTADVVLTETKATA